MTRPASNQPPAHPGGRRDTRRHFEQWARNPSCQANCISAVHDISMAEVASREGIQSSMGQSPFAIARGHTYERALFRDGAQRLFEVLRNADIVDADASGFLDLRPSSLRRTVGRPDVTGHGYMRHSFLWHYLAERGQVIPA